jgi:hypothetical protein
MKKLILAVLVSLSFSVSASPLGVVTGLVNPASFGVMLAYYAAKNEKIDNACYNDKLRTVSHVNNPNGYSFEVAGCDYQANKDNYIVK